MFSSDLSNEKSIMFFFFNSVLPLSHHSQNGRNHCCTGVERKKVSLLLSNDCELGDLV